MSQEEIIPKPQKFDYHSITTRREVHHDHHDPISNDYGTGHGDNSDGGRGSYQGFLQTSESESDQHRKEAMRKISRNYHTDLHKDSIKEIDEESSHSEIQSSHHSHEIDFKTRPRSRGIHR